MNGSRELREVTDFDVVHERLMHVFIVRDDLAFFAHEHPERAGRGLFRLRFRFPAPGRYRVFADVAPKDAGAQILTGEVLVSGVVVRDAAAPSALAFGGLAHAPGRRACPRGAR